MAVGPFAKAIAHYLTLDRRRFHVPGHGGRLLFASPGVSEALLAADLSEVEGLDVLSAPQGCLAESQAQAAALYGVAQSYYLVNGASVGLQAAMLAAIQPGDSVLIARNAHRALISGLILTGARPFWLLPERLGDWGLWGALTPACVRAALDAHPQARLLVLTSPTYEGIGSDVAAITALCRARGVLTLIDEAHGALWPFHEALPPSALYTPADCVVQSLHKSAGSLTQTAIAHLPHGSQIPPDRFQQALNTLHTTSPSMPLLASAEAAVFWLASAAGRTRLAATLVQAHQARQTLERSLRRLRLLAPQAPSEAIPAWDPLALFLHSPYESGEAWGGRLEQAQRLAFESVSPSGVLYKLGLGLDAQDMAALLSALQADDQRLVTGAVGAWARTPASWAPFVLPERVMTPREAFFAPGERVARECAAGRIAQETIVHCPPGIPLTIPGERLPQALPEGLPPTLAVVREGVAGRPSRNW